MLLALTLQNAEVRALLPLGDPVAVRQLLRQIHLRQLRLEAERAERLNLKMGRVPTDNTCH